MSDTQQIESNEGEISLCPYANCGFRCCQFNHGNYIVMHPGEWEAAKAAGHSLNHLKIIAEENGGVRTICYASDTSTCDKGYKPLDCASYPFFPVLKTPESQIESMIKGSKCPLPLERLGRHAAWVQGAWQTLLEQNQEIRSWLSKVELVGYEEVPLSRLLANQK